MPPKKVAKAAETASRTSSRVKASTTKAVAKPPTALVSKTTSSKEKGKNMQPPTAPIPRAKRKMADEDASSRPVKQVKATRKATAAKTTRTEEPATKKSATKASEKKTTPAKATTAKATATRKAATKAATKPAPINNTKPAGIKRKLTDEEDTSPRPTKKVSISEPPKSKPARSFKIPRHGRRTIINRAPTEKLNVYVFGEGSSGELGLGSAKSAVDVKRPRLNPNLSADSVGIVQVAAGGMHAVALTHDNKILTWGVNDNGAVGRNTDWEGGMKDIDGDSDESSDDNDSDSGMNPKESTPGEVSGRYFEEGTNFVQVAAGDSATFAVTDEGYVYGWGTFRVRKITIPAPLRAHWPLLLQLATNCPPYIISRAFTDLLFTFRTTKVSLASLRIQKLNVDLLTLQN
jgi:regulator of chromosome condensation